MNFPLILSKNKYNSANIADIATIAGPSLSWSMEAINNNDTAKIPIDLAMFIKISGLAVFVNLSKESDNVLITFFIVSINEPFIVKEDSIFLTPNINPANIPPGTNILLTSEKSLVLNGLYIELTKLVNICFNSSMIRPSTSLAFDTELAMPSIMVVNMLFVAKFLKLLNVPKKLSTVFLTASNIGCKESI